MNDSTEDQPVRYVWHPAIEAMLWLLGWLVVAVSCGIIWEFLASKNFDPNAVPARSVLVLIAFATLIPLLFLIDFLGGLAQHAWDNYEPAFAAKLQAAVLGVFLLAAIPLVWLMSWLLELAWPHILRWFAEVDLGMTARDADGADVTTWVVLSILSLLLAFLVFKILYRGAFYAYRHAVEVLGLPRFVLGIFMMAYLRMLVPRRDFFMHAPIVSWALPVALAIVVHEMTPIAMFAWILPVLLLMLLMPERLSVIAPPLWLFLSASEFESFRAFHNLRSQWQRHGLTLLDRGGPGGVEFYNDWRSRISSGFVPYSPEIARVWSLRTRPAVWQTAMRLLAAFVPVVIVDQRQSSEIVEFEVNWLTRRGYLDKTYVLAEPGNDGAAVERPEEAHQVDEETLAAWHWSDAGLESTDRPLEDK